MSGRYANIKKVTHADGTKFDSMKELHRYQDLILLRRAKLINNLVVHPRFALCIKGVSLKMRSDRYPKGRQLHYVADFSYTDTKTLETVIEDVKMQSGFRTEVYKIKRSIMQAMGHEIVEI